MDRGRLEDRVRALVVRLTAAMRVEPSVCLLAVDLGLRTGFAYYSDAGRLIRYGSRHFGSTAQLRRATSALLDQVPEVSVLALEGGGDTAAPWIREAERRGLHAMQIQAERWRSRLLLPRDRRSGERAKRRAGVVARRIIEQSGAKRPTSLRHDAAEAILIGYWAAIELGWIPSVPENILSPS